MVIISEPSVMCKIIVISLFWGWTNLTHLGICDNGVADGLNLFLHLRIQCLREIRKKKLKNASDYLRVS